MKMPTGIMLWEDGHFIKEARPDQLANWFEENGLNPAHLAGQILHRESGHMTLWSIKERDNATQVTCNPGRIRLWEFTQQVTPFPDLPKPYRLYIAGPMTGLPESNYPAFHEAAAQLRKAGFEVVNPAETNLPPETSWLDFMRAGITGLATCDAIALLPGWTSSKGAWTEATLAHQLGLPGRTVNEWLTTHPKDTK